jgi:hypothetical protein
MQMRFDNALQVPQGSGIGVSVERTTGSTATS